MNLVTTVFRTSLVYAAFALLLAPAESIGQPPGFDNLNDMSLVEDALENESAQYDGVNIFVERLKGTAMNFAGGLGMSDFDFGCAQCIFYKVIPLLSSVGGIGYIAYVMDMFEVYEEGGIGMSAEMMDVLGNGMMVGGALLNSSFGGLLSAAGPQANPLSAMMVMGNATTEAADARREAAESLANANETAQGEANRIGGIQSQMRYSGVAPGPMGEMTCFLADGLDMPMEAGEDQTAKMESASLCVDNAERVIVKHRIEGTMVADGEARQFFIEVEKSDFRHVDGCNLYRPYRSVNRIGGMLDDAQRAEMQEAAAQLDEFEQQLAAMPPAQRAMMEGMMGGQMDMVRNMANGGAIEHVQEIEEIICNPDLKALLSPVDPAFELAQIQRDLVTLGYTPGNTDGVMDVLTEVAISQYQAERGLPVTGQPSTDLALRLSSETSGQG